MQLAELNIAFPKYERDDVRFADFVNNLDRINGLAEVMLGFVWRFDDSQYNDGALHSPWPGAAITLSVWERVEDLEHFVWNTVHKQFYNRKAEWFDGLDSHHFVMWAVEDGHQPDYWEAKERLDHLNNHGNSDYAFDWSHLPHVKLWQSQQCG